MTDADRAVIDDLLNRVRKLEKRSIRHFNRLARIASVVAELAGLKKMLVLSGGCGPACEQCGGQGSIPWSPVTDGGVGAPAGLVQPCPSCRPDDSEPAGVDTWRTGRPWFGEPAEQAAPVFIAQAAIRDAYGRVWTLPRPGRHHDIIKVIRSFGVDDRPEESQGFVTSEGEYVDRQSAAVIAFAAGQISRPKAGLFSEDVWDGGLDRLFVASVADHPESEDDDEQA